MKTISLSININAPREIIWEAITNNKYYNGWTKVFTPTSYFEGSWDIGEIIRFLAKNKEGSTEGMIAEIAESKFPAFISIKHMGYIYDGVDDTESDEVKSWAPAFENYTLEALEDKNTRFTVDVEVTDDYYDMFQKLWPKALQALKVTAEALGHNEG